MIIRNCQKQTREDFFPLGKLFQMCSTENIHHEPAKGEFPHAAFLFGGTRVSSVPSGVESYKTA